jgi:hypothetical protein
VPFQSDINRSSPLSSPYEHASVYSSAPGLQYRIADVCHTSTKALLALLKLFQQAEVSGNFGTHVCGCTAIGGGGLREEVGCLEPRYRTG